MKAITLIVLPLVPLVLNGAAWGQLKNQPAPEPPETVDVVGQMERYLYLVDHLARLAENPTASGIAAVQQASEMLKGHPQDAIDYFNKVLPDVKNDSVRRAVRLQLASLYQKTNQQDKALEQLRELMVFASPAAPSRGGRSSRGAAPSRADE